MFLVQSKDKGLNHYYFYEEEIIIFNAGMWIFEIATLLRKSKAIYLMEILCADFHRLEITL